VQSTVSAHHPAGRSEQAVRAEARQRKNPDARYHHKSGEGIFRLRAVFATSYTYQGFLAAKTGDLNGATAALRKALELNPKHGPTHLILGWVLTKQHKLDEARDEYRLALLYDTMLSADEKTAALRAIAEINERLVGK